MGTIEISIPETEKEMEALILAEFIAMNAAIHLREVRERSEGIEDVAKAFARKIGATTPEDFLGQSIQGMIDTAIAIGESHRETKQ